MRTALKTVSEITKIIENVMRAKNVTHLRLVRRDETFLQDGRESKEYKIVVAVEGHKYEKGDIDVTVSIAMYDVNTRDDEDTPVAEIAAQVEMYSGERVERIEIRDETNGAFAQLFGTNMPQEMLENALKAIGLLNDVPGT